VLTGNQRPDHSRISDFRLVHLDALAGLFVQVLRLCQKAGLVSLGNGALDGTKVKANASKHKAMSHERMLKTEAQLEAEIAALLRKAELIDAQEDAGTPRLLERWYRFAVLRLRDEHAVGDPARQRLQRRCSDVKELIAKIEQFVAAYNRTKEPFNRITTADSILKKLKHLCSKIS
jgi:hypothetical protein